MRSTVEDVDGCVPVLLLHVAGCDDPELLMGFIVLALRDPAFMLNTLSIVFGYP